MDAFIFRSLKTAWMTSSPNETRNKLTDTPNVLAYIPFLFYAFRLSLDFVLCLRFLSAVFDDGTILAGYVSSDDLVWLPDREDEDRCDVLVG